MHRPHARLLGRIAEGPRRGRRHKLAIRVLDAPGATPDMRAQPAGTCFDDPQLRARQLRRGALRGERTAPADAGGRRACRPSHRRGTQDGHDVRVAPLPIARRGLAGQAEAALARHGGDDNGRARLQAAVERACTSSFPARTA
jgi:hypothetical protein